MALFTRRDALLSLAAFSGAFTLSASSLAPLYLPRKLNGTFLQVWKSDLDLPPTVWAERLRLFGALQCRDLILQWVSFGEKYAMSGALLADVLDFALAAGLKVTLGLPYDGGYWKAMTQGDRAAFMARAADQGVAFLGADTHAGHPAFAGYYIPYEIDQYSWQHASERDILIRYLRRVNAARGAAPLAISTFHSALPTAATLEDLWSAVLPEVPLRLMVQDGVGVFGMGNYAHLEPLFAMLRRKDATFDVIVELFTEKPSGKTDGTTFAADSTTMSRLQAQMIQASGSGAERLIAFAVHPYMTDGTRGAAELRQAYARALAGGTGS
ncbi:DUF4434 domain-containing protein [Azorhizobium doebereinerae]|uniref:DUF4434 domain-containing protein n=1 Tax=Azorhizobium doebereinerae TaxID=281091 RepID=UPI00040E9D11|nr:DUF4434 domain-containing protein [Azorhizobium doebereinerae]